MPLKLITAPDELAVDLNDAKLHLRVDQNAEDSLISALIHSATSMAEQKTGRAIMPQTWELTLDAFPDAFELTCIPVASVSSVKYINTAGEQVTLDSTLYTLDATDDYSPARIIPAYGATWPAAREQANAVTVRYVAGYAEVPEAIKTWIKVMTAAMYENRSAETVGSGSAIQLVQLGYVDRLLDRFKVWGV